MIFLKDRSKAMKVGIGMISRGEVGLIVAGIGVTSGALSSNIYTTVIIMVAVTTMITPIWLKKAYSKEQVHCKMHYFSESNNKSFIYRRMTLLILSTYYSILISNF